jgi:hypothetical protein
MCSPKPDLLEPSPSPAPSQDSSRYVLHDLPLTSSHNLEPLESGASGPCRDGSRYILCELQLTSSPRSGSLDPLSEDSVYVGYIPPHQL